jgi:serine/threonine-protein kinase
MPLSQGQVLNDRYRIVSLLGRGGFGAVYRAWDLNLEGPVALKENLNTTIEAVRQFEREARMLANLHHAGLPYVIDHFTLPGQGQYMVMEFIEGQDLQDMLQKNPRGLPEAQVLPWIDQVCDALTYLHSQSPPIIHRDIKPANIKINREGKAVLVDFGIAKVYQPGSKTVLGARAVTQGYSPPEQYGGGTTDARSDVYALGATLYSILTGQVPVDSLQRQLGKALPAPRQINPAISPIVEQAILRAMEPEIQNRFQEIAEFRAALKPHREAYPVFAPDSGAGRREIGGYSPPPPRPPGYAPTVAVPGPAQDYGAQTPSAPPPRKWMTFGIGIFLILCILGGVIGGIGGYFALYPSPQATPLLSATALAQTATALALQVNNPWTPTLMTPASPTGLPSLEPTLTPSSLPSATEVPTLAPTASDTPNATWQPCPGTYPSRLHVGDRAFVSTDPPLPNRVRTQPNTDSPVLGFLQVGEKIEILEGPYCGGQWIWWRVRSLESSMAGWTAEGDQSNYWLVPLP